MESPKTEPLKARLIYDSAASPPLRYTVPGETPGMTRRQRRALAKSLYKQSKTKEVKND